jgi:phosphatidylinositol-3-phosphatase
MSKKLASLGLAFALIAAPMFADEGAVPKGVPHLDHVFFIMMENHGFEQVLNNPNEPYLNSLIASGKVNLATNYFAVGHPSLTNYLEVVGGSNFGIRSDNSPNWHSKTCTPNLQSGLVNADDGAGSAVPVPVPIETSNICPISGSGMDAETPAVDTWNEVTLPEFAFLADLDGVKSVPAAHTVGKTIGDQLVRAGLSWKSYQEDLPAGGADGVNNSDGFFSNLITVNSLLPNEAQTLIDLYAVKHNPFAYFRDVQEGYDPDNSLKNIAGFEGAHGLYEDLASGHAPNFSFIAPNQCNDQHGRGNAGPQCDFDPGTDGLQAGLNPALIYYGDLTLRNLLKAIHASPAWQDGNNAIVIVWDENDYSGTPTAQSGLFPVQNQNRVVLTVETNHDADGVQSGRYYNSFSVLKSLEAGFGLPCLNHACDKNVNAMSDLFGERANDGR